MYIYTHMYTYIHTCTCIYIYTRIYTYTCIYTQLHTSPQRIKARYMSIVVESVQEHSRRTFNVQVHMRCEFLRQPKPRRVELALPKFAL